MAILDLGKLAFSHAEIMQIPRDKIALKDIENELYNLKIIGYKFFVTFGCWDLPISHLLMAILDLCKWDYEINVLNGFSNESLSLKILA